MRFIASTEGPQVADRVPTTYQAEQAKGEGPTGPNHQPEVDALVAEALAHGVDPTDEVIDAGYPSDEVLGAFGGEVVGIMVIGADDVARQAVKDLVRLALAVNLLRKAHGEVGFDTDEDKALQRQVLDQADQCIGNLEGFIEEVCGESYRPTL